jgi:hypothetical protein
MILIMLSSCNFLFFMKLFNKSDFLLNFAPYDKNLKNLE